MVRDLVVELIMAGTDACKAIQALCRWSKPRGTEVS